MAYSISFAARLAALGLALALTALVQGATWYGFAVKSEQLAQAWGSAPDPRPGWSTVAVAELPAVTIAARRESVRPVLPEPAVLPVARAEAARAPITQ